MIFFVYKAVYTAKQEIKEMIQKLYFDVRIFLRISWGNRFQQVFFTTLTGGETDGCDNTVLIQIIVHVMKWILS